MDRKDESSMKKRFSFLCALVLLILARPCTMGLAEDAPLRFSLPQPLYAGQQSLLVQIENENPPGLRVNAFSDGVQLGVSASSLENGQVLLSLSRPLRAGEEILLMLDVQGTRKASGIFPVEARFGCKLQKLRNRIDGLWPVWRDGWEKAFLEGTVNLNISFDLLPFASYPDEAPEIMVEEQEGKARVYVSEPLDENWRVSLAFGIPAVFSPCEWDAAAGAYTGPVDFDSVYLVSDGAAERIGITVVYERRNQFLASYPIVEWVQPDADDPIAFNCYGFGTARSFEGAMYAIVGPQGQWYAEFDVEHSLSSYTNLLTECVYDGNGVLLSGEEPEGYLNPVVIW